MTVEQISGTWWLLDSKGRLLARFENRTTARRYLLEAMRCTSVE